MADILVVDDEESLAYSMRLALKRSGHACRIAGTVADGVKACLASPPELMLVDVQLPDGNGIEFVTDMHNRGVDVPAIVITAHGTIAKAVEAMKHGAADFLQKPLSMEELCLAVDRCLETRRMRNELNAHREAQQRASEQIQIIGRCSTMQRTLALGEKLASLPSDGDGGVVATLFLGETGTGKEVFARYFHHHSPRADRPFVHVNCTAIPESLFESELFGHERGTFTDAKEGKKGLLEIADSGTLFLDEIGDMPLTLQAKLLVAIETGRFRRLGGVSERSVDLRVAAATNSDLELKIKKGTFRADLYYRLQAFSVVLPPLRERGDDLNLLAEHFLEKFSRKFHRSRVKLSKAALQAVRAYSWPGNVRELSNVLRRAVLIHESDVLEADDLNLAPPAHTSNSAATPADPAPHESTNEPARTAEGLSLEAAERQAIEAAMHTAGGNISEAARLLGISRGGLRHRLAKHGLTDSQNEQDAAS